MATGKILDDIVASTGGLLSQLKMVGLIVVVVFGSIGVGIAAEKTLLLVATGCWMLLAVAAFPCGNYATAFAGTILACLIRWHQPRPLVLLRPFRLMLRTILVDDSSESDRQIHSECKPFPAATLDVGGDVVRWQARVEPPAALEAARCVGLQGGVARDVAAGLCRAGAVVLCVVRGHDARSLAAKVHSDMHASRAAVDLACFSPLLCSPPPVLLCGISGLVWGWGGAVIMVCLRWCLALKSPSFPAPNPPPHLYHPRRPFAGLKACTRLASRFDGVWCCGSEQQGADLENLFAPGGPVSRG